METVLAGGRPDAMVWYGDLTYWHAAHEQIGDIPARWRGSEGRSLMHRELGVGEYVPGCCAFDIREGAGVAIVHSRADDIRTVTYRTPVGTLTERWQYSPPSFSWGHIEFPVKTPADLQVVQYIYQHRQYVPCPDKVEKLEHDLAEHGLPVIATHPSPMAEMYKHWIGVTQLSYMLCDEPEAVEKAVAIMAEAQAPMWQITADSICNYVILCENFTAEGMAGLFDRYFRAFLTQKIALLHSRGKKVLCHIDGTLRGLAEKLPEVGVDCLDAVTPKPVGDVGMDEIRQLVGPDVFILGGLPGAMFAPPFGPKQMEHHVKEIIRLHKASGRFMFGVADQVPPNGDLELVRLVTRLVGEFGHYD
jgi:hypothetical protein